MQDSSESIYSVELALLRNVAETSSELVKASSWEEFCEAGGGMEYCIARHAEAVAAWKNWNIDGE